MNEESGPERTVAPDEHRLINDLRAVAASVTAQADLGEVESGAARVRSRRRVAVGVAAAAIVAAAGGAGFGLGRAASVDTDNSAAMDVPPPAAPVESVPATSAVVAPDSAPATTAPDQIGVPLDEDAAATSMVPIDDLIVADSEMTDSSYLGAPAQLNILSERTDDTGTRIRVLRGPTYEVDYAVEYARGWTPADFCGPTGELRVTFDGPNLVDVASFAYFTTLFDRFEVQVGVAGAADGQPKRLAMVQTDTDATSATVAWADGVSGTAPVVEGFAIVSVSNAANPEAFWNLGFTLELEGPTGTTSVTNSELDHSRDASWRTACEEPPPPLPDAGEQPADPDAGQALADRFAELWTFEVPFADKTENLLDDWTGVVTAAMGVRAGPNADAAASATRTLDEYVFTSPTEAWLRYTVATDMGTFSQRYATATLVDGMWQFPRAAVCQDFSLAGSPCEPLAEQIFPPAWYDRYPSDCVDPESGQLLCNQG